jgi:hypothetical protein
MGWQSVANSDDLSTWKQGAIGAFLYSEVGEN